MTGIVLSGGGARGAYEAGIIRYIRDFFVSVDIPYSSIIIEFYDVHIRIN